MANNNELDDQLVSSLVQSVKYRIPAQVEEQANTAIKRAGEKKSRWLQRPLLWLPVSVTVAAVIILTLFTFHPFMKKKATEPVNQISEITTIFELKEKNIKILWVQKKDFSLKITD
jgi:anti-sigma-K factor RskA